MSVPTTCYFALFMSVFDVLRTSRIWPEEKEATAWSAVAVLSAIEGVALVSLDLWSEMLGAEPPTITRNDSLILYAGLFGLNFMVFLRRRRWEALRVSFRALPIRRQRLIKWSGRITVLLACVGCAYTLHRYLGWTPRR